MPIEIVINDRNNIHIAMSNGQVEIQLNAEFISKPPTKREGLWWKFVRNLVFRRQIVVGDIVELTLGVQNNSSYDIPPGNLIIRAFINETQIYNPTMVPYPMISPYEKLILPTRGSPPYIFVAFRPGVVRVQVEFNNASSFVVTTVSDLTGERYNYNSSNVLKYDIVHDNLEVYTLVLLYSTVVLLIISVISSVISILLR